jgi:hypothetical protein
LSIKLYEIKVNVKKLNGRFKRLWIVLLYLDVVHARENTLHGLMSWGFCFMFGWLSEFVFLQFLEGWL